MPPSVLLIDDEPDLRWATAEILRAAGFDVWEAATGEDGLRRAGDRPDLVLCDVGLPDLDGFEVCRRLRDRSDTAALPILFLSGIYRDPKDKLRGLGEGADGYLVRPITSEELVGTVRLLLRRPVTGGGARATAALAEVGRQLAKTATEPETLQRITETIRRLFGVRVAVFYENLGEQGLRCVAVAGEDAERWLGRTLPKDEGMAGDAGELRELAAVPLIAYGDPIGALVLLDETPRELSSADLEVLATFADICALAAHNARLYATSQRALEHTQLLLSVGAELTEPSTSVEVMRRAARLVCRLLDVFREAVQRGTPLVCPDVRNDPRLDHPLIRKMPLTPSALVAFPVAGDRGTRGVLLCYWWTTPRHLEAHEVRLAVGVVEQLARVLEHLRLADEADRQRREAEFIADLAAKLNMSLHLDAVLEEVTHGALELCRSDVARTAFRDPEADHLVFRHCMGTRFDGYATLHVPIGSGATGRAVATGLPQRSPAPDEAPMDGALGEAARVEELVTELSIPITIGGAVAGALNVGNRIGQPFDERDEVVLLRLAAHAAIAIQNASLFQGSETRWLRMSRLTEITRLLNRR